MNTLTHRALSTIGISLVLLCVVGCQSTPPQTGGNTTDAQHYASKQKDYEQLLQEWQALKPGISRLLAIESELNLLLGELEQLSTSLAQQQSSAQVASTLAAAPVSMVSATPIVAPAPQAMPAIVNEPVIERPRQTAQIHTQVTRTNANYALQVASITEPHRLPQMWQQMINKNPQLLADLEPNFQKTQVRNTDYYRLKVGSFDTLREANGKCSDLKAAGFPCLVVDYTGSNFSQLAH